MSKSSKCSRKFLKSKLQMTSNSICILNKYVKERKMQDQINLISRLSNISLNYPRMTLNSWSRTLHPISESIGRKIAQLNGVRQLKTSLRPSMKFFKQPTSSLTSKLDLSMDSFTNHLRMKI